MLKVALCVSGGIKFKEAFENTVSFLKSKYDVTVIAHVWDNLTSNFTKPSSLHEFSNLDVYSYVEKHTDIYTIEDFSSMIMLFTELKSLYEDTRILEQRRYDIGIPSMFYSIYKCNELRKQYELTCGIKYDCVIRARFDSIVNDIYIESYNLEHLNIPFGYDYGGINDQFALGNSDVMNIYSDMYLNFSKAFYTTRQYHPETLLKAYLDSINIKIDRPNIKVIIRNGVKE